MAAEPSALGSLVRWSLDDLPTVEKKITSPEEISRLRVPNPEKDGLMPLVLNLYKYVQGKLDGTGHEIKIVAARGPLTVASFLYGLTEFLMGIRIEPDWMKKLLELTTETAITWLKAQLAAVPSAEGILVLDDIPGLMSKDDYAEFAHPYLQAIFNEFNGKLKLYHNDANTTHILPLLTQLDIDIFNFGKEVPLPELYKYTAGKMVVMGNISPLETLREKGPAEVRKEVAEFLRDAPDKYLLLSAGGGVSPGTPKENIAVLNEMGAVIS
jgi:uroporphyrinogen decarboxylase